MNKPFRYLLSGVIVLVAAGLQVNAQTSATSAAATDVLGELVSHATQPVLVNGIRVSSGTPIPASALIETGDVGSTVKMETLGSLDLSPNTRVQLDYDANRTIRVKLFLGCARLRAEKNTLGEIGFEAPSKVATTNRTSGGVLYVCLPGAEARLLPDRTPAGKTEPAPKPSAKPAQPGTRCTRLTRPCKKGKFPWCLFWCGCR